MPAVTSSAVDDGEKSEGARRFSCPHMLYSERYEIRFQSSNTKLGLRIVSTVSA